MRLMPDWTRKTRHAQIRLIKFASEMILLQE